MWHTLTNNPAHQKPEDANEDTTSKKTDEKPKEDPKSKSPGSGSS